MATSRLSRAVRVLGHGPWGSQSRRVDFAVAAVSFGVPLGCYTFVVDSKPPECCLLQGCHRVILKQADSPRRSKEVGLLRAFAFKTSATKVGVLRR